MRNQENQSRKQKLGRAFRFWLDGRALPGRILRGRERDEDVLLLTLFGVGFFLAHWEETIRSPPLEIMVDPLDALPAHWIPWVWAMAVVAMIFNGWWLDRWVARESGVERGLRPHMRWFRRILGALPILGFLVIPIWRWLIVRRPLWAFAEESPSLLALLGEERARVSQGTSPGRRIQRWLDRQHGRMSPALVLGVWHFTSGFLIIRFVVEELSAMNMVGGKWVLLASIVGLRAVGASLNGTLLWRFYREGGRSGWNLLWQLPLAIGWFFPWRLVYLQSLLGLAFLDRRRQRLRLFQRSNYRPFSTKHGDVEHASPAWKWFMGQVRFDELARPRHARTSMARYLTFSLVFEMAFMIYVLLEVEANWPSLSMPVGIPVILALLWILVRGIQGAALMAWGSLRNLRGLSGDWDDGLAARVRFSLVLVTAVSMAISGMLRDGGPESGSGVMQIFALGGFFLSFFFVAQSLVGLVRQRQVDPHVIRWIVIFFTLSALATAAGSRPSGGCVFWFLSFLIPFVVHSLAIWQVRWMVHPFRLSDIVRPQIPLGIQLRLLGIVAATVLPLGGLALPAALKARRRLEPEFDRLWPF